MQRKAICMLHQACSCTQTDEIYIVVGTRQRLWSPAAYRNTTQAFPRLAEFRCHLVRRGVNAASMHPGSCWSMREIN